MHPEDATSIGEDHPRDVLRLDRCPDCGYLLAGLPEQGICPECGFAYRPDMIVLYGWSRRVRGDQGTQRWGIVRWSLFVLPWGTIILWLAAVAYLTTDPMLIVFFLLSATYIVRVIYRRSTLTRDIPAPVQLRLQPEGFAQRDGVGPVKLCPWRFGKRQLFIRMAGRRRCRIRSWRHFQVILLRSRVIDFEFDCDAQTCEHIRNRVAQWRRQTMD